MLKEIDDTELVKFLVERIEKDQNDCWIWQKSVDKNGYGMCGNLSIWCKRYGKSKAHQLSYIAFLGLYPRQLLICHTCHNPSCINPAHLKLGTHTDNMKDRALSGRTYHGCGETNSRAKLTQQDVDYIRNSINKKTPQQLAQKYNVTASTIRQIRAYKSWNK